jgi:radical SAM protein with 4Fe4S-binding SPASM domain
MMSKVTPQRAFNAAQTFASYFVSKITRNTYHSGYPISFSIEPTTSCNLGCPECPSGLRQFSRDTGNLDPDFYKTVIGQLAKKSTYVLFYFQGEPYINPEFLDMVKYASDKKLYTATSTNAHFLNDKTAKRTVESGLDRMIISIDGTTQEVYEQYRKKGKLDKVIAGTKKIIEWKKKLKSKTPHIIFQFLVVKPNEHQIDDVHKLARELGVDEVRLKTAQVYDYENGNPLIPENDKYSRYKQLDNGKWTVKNKLLDHCWRMWSGCVITWDGLIVPCCFDKDATHQMGDMKEKSFKEIWNSPMYRSFRGAIFKSRSEIDICKNCTEGTKVWA